MAALLARRVDALVLASAQPPTRTDLFRAVEEQKVPYVLIDRKIAGPVSLISGDDDLGYLLRVLRNTFYSSHRSAQRRPQTAAMPEDYEPVDQRPAMRPDEAFAAHEVFDVIAGLAPDFRDALVAVDVAGLSYREAAKLLGAKEATITSRLFRARGQVAAGMDRGRSGVLEEKG